MSKEEPAKTRAERRKRGMFTVPVQIRGRAGTLEVFEDIVTSLNVSCDGLLLSTSRGGYSVGQKLQVGCPYWSAPTAINVPRSAHVVRCVLLPDYTYALALQFLSGACEEGAWAMPATPFPNQVRVLCVLSRISRLPVHDAKCLKRMATMSWLSPRHRRRSTFCTARHLTSSLQRQKARTSPARISAPL